MKPTISEARPTGTGGQANGVFRLPIAIGIISIIIGNRNFVLFLTRPESFREPEKDGSDPPAGGRGKSETPRQSHRGII